MRDAEQIVRDFPDIELSYEKKIHNKVPFHNVVLTVPKGRKYLVWFRVYKRGNVCLLLELDRYKKGIKNITIHRSCFSSELCIKKGTLLYGTKFMHNSSTFLNVEDVFFFKGRNVTAQSPANKLQLLSNILKTDIKQVSYSPKEIVFGLPVMAKNKEALLKKLPTVPYPLYAIQYRNLNRRAPFYNECTFQKEIVERIFIVRAALEDDIYDLYVRTAAAPVSDKIIQYTAAFISDVKTSMWMNSLFRNIKENENLDALEESDDEEEFENIELDKYVDLKKEYKMKCVYLPKFRAWKPITLCEDGIVSNVDDIKKTEKNNN